MKQALSLMAFLGLTAGICPARADDAPAKPQAPDTTKQAGMMRAYLGVEVESVPAALSSQLPGILPRGQGVLVMHVAKDSPAAKAGIQPDDVLMSFGDQKISSPEQLVKLVRGDKPGQAIAMSLVRGGKTEACKITLGEREVPNHPDKPHVFRFLPDEQFQEIFREAESKNGSAAWDTFDGLKLSRLDANRWRAEIEYRSKDGKKENKNFEGTREEIRKMIQGEKDLPANERTHLLRALNVHDPIFEFHFPRIDALGPEFRQQP